nr:MAG TPA: hypothetical protein [Caudoviricetes sp.]
MLRDRRANRLRRASVRRNARRTARPRLGLQHRRTRPDRHHPQDTRNERHGEDP